MFEGINWNSTQILKTFQNAVGAFGLPNLNIITLTIAAYQHIANLSDVLKQTKFSKVVNIYMCLLHILKFEEI